MSNFVVVRNMKSPMQDISINGEPDENVTYNLMVDVCLSEIREKKGTGDEQPDKTYIFTPVGDLRFVNMSKYDNYGAVEGE
jgi:hypothetical protein